ncbi:hypothetical protein [Bacteroides sp.]|uniref:hypothetical protein n=1 Tax=Bacteroides sp. TaxID=29523 RepID=UPI0011DD2A4E|nr:hypothetical protein [Bacteroides sp.]
MEDIKPIDKFILDRYVKEEDDLLEYVEILGCKFHPDYDFIKVKEEIENKAGINEEEETVEEAVEKDEGEIKFVFMGTTVTQEFKKRYNAKVLNAHYTFEKYLQDEDVQNTLEALNIDKEKFWYLLLFVSDYIHGSCLEGAKVKEAPKLLVEKLMQQIGKNIDKDGSKVSFIKPMTLTLKIQEEHHSIEIDDPISLAYIHYAYNAGKEYFNIDKPTIFDIQEIDRKGKATEPDTVLVAMFYNLLNSFLKLLPKTNKSKIAKAYTTVFLNKTLLISRLVYLTNLSKDERYTGIDKKKEKLCPNFIKDQIKSYKDYEILRANKFY